MDQINYLNNVVYYYLFTKDAGLAADFARKVNLDLAEQADTVTMDEVFSSFLEYRQRPSKDRAAKRSANDSGNGSMMKRPRINDGASGSVADEEGDDANESSGDAAEHPDGNAQPVAGAIVGSHV